MNHSFDIENARIFGIEEAIIIENIKFWIVKNRANQSHFHDGHYWTYNSVKAFAELFPYMSEKTIRRTLESLEKKQIIISGNYDKSGYDRTKWYAFKNEDFFLNGDESQRESAFAHLDKWKSPSGQMDFTKSENPCSEKGEPIPDITPVITTDQNPVKNMSENPTLHHDDETKGDIKEKDHIAQEILSFLNKTTGKRYKPTVNNLKHIKSRLNEGFTEEDFYKVITIKTKEWLKDEKMNMYLRPETLFGNKFESYLNKNTGGKLECDMTYTTTQAGLESIGLANVRLS